jgi:hypothetical protein
MSLIGGDGGGSGDVRESAILPDGYEWKAGVAGDLQLWKENQIITSVNGGVLAVLADQGLQSAIQVDISADGGYGRIMWTKPDGREIHLVFMGENIGIWRTDDQGEPSQLLTESGAISAWRSLNSLAATAKSDNPQLHPFTIPASEGYVDWEYSMVPLILTEMAGGEVRGEAFTVRDQGVIACNKDMYAVEVELIMVGNWPTNRNVVIGVGIGDIHYLSSGDVLLPGEEGLPVYISRFIAASAGRGDNRDVTLSISAQPVGRSTTDIEVSGVKAGDLIFPVIYAEEDTPTGITVKDLIFVVREISV